MSIFGTIMNKIFHSGGASTEAATTTATAEAGAGTAASPSTQTAASGQPAPTNGQTAPANVDVEQVLTGMAAQKGGGGNWNSSIVDLLKLLDLDSSLDARKTLASELNVHAGADGTAEQNIALHKAVMRKMAENGGKVPESLRA